MAPSVGEVEIAAADVEVERGWLGRGYGHSTPEAERATELLAEREDVVLEPVYTAKAVAATARAQPARRLRCRARCSTGTHTATADRRSELTV